MRRWDGVVDEYLGECEVRGLTKEVIQVRGTELAKWGIWLKRRRPRPVIESIQPEQIVEYIKRRTAFRSKSTVSSVMSHMRCMGEHLVKKGLWSINPLRWIRGPKLYPWARVPKRIGQAHLKALWDEAANSREIYARHLNLALLGMMYGTGLRRGDLRRLDTKDWSREEGLLRINGHKTGRERMVPLPRGSEQCLEAYLPHRQNVLEKTGRLQEPAMFVGRNGKRLSDDQISSHVHRLADRAGVPLSSVHQFRHTCASDLLEKGVTLPQVQGILGHAVIASLMRYLAISDPERRRAMEKHPIVEFLAEAQKTGGQDGQ